MSIVYIYSQVTPTYAMRSFIFLRNKHTHTQERGKEVITQKHTTISLKSHDNFYEDFYLIHRKLKL